MRTCGVVGAADVVSLWAIFGVFWPFLVRCVTKCY